jgi:hypothetical protein
VVQGRAISIYQRCSSRPAAAVIPAPIAYIKVVAVKKLVVELWAWPICLPHGCTGSVGPFLLGNPMLFIERSGEPGLLP